MKLALTTPRRHSAFTLVELMVVVAILALLVVLLVPSYSRWQQKAMVAKCISNLKGLGDRMTGYLSTSHSRYYPHSYDLDDQDTPQPLVAPEKPWWQVPALAELYDEGFLRCPGDTVFPNAMALDRMGEGFIFNSSYACNWYLDHRSKPQFRRVHGHAKPHGLILFGESETAYYRNNDALPDEEINAYFPSSRHGNTLNFLMFDLTVRSLDAPEIVDGCNGTIGHEDDWGRHPCLVEKYGVTWTDEWAMN